MHYLFHQGNLHIQETRPYQAGKPIEEVERELGELGNTAFKIIKLASNENPLGASPHAMAAAIKAINQVHMYPDASYHRLCDTIAKYNNVDIKNITVGNGSENCLEVLAKAFLNEKSNAIVDQYCFATIRILIKGYNATEITIPSNNYRHDVVATISKINQNTKMIFVVNPNNPTGTYISHNELTYLLDNVPPHIIVVIDEAYHEYVEKPDYPKSVQLLDKYPNLVIARTFSKVFGLAGLRLGYLMSNPAISDLLHRSRLPFNVNTCAVEAGIAALNDYEFLAQTKNTNRSGMQQLSNGFDNLGIEYIPSVANFITINTKQDATLVYNKLLQQGVIVRPLVPYNLPQFLRITIGTYEQNERLLSII